MSGVDQAAPGGTTTARGASPTAVPLAGATAPAGARGGREAYDSGRRWEFLYFAVRNKKLLLGLGVEIIFVLAAIIGPYFAPYPAKEFVAAAALHPSSQHLLGTTYFGQDVFSLLLDSLRESYLVGFLGAAFAGLIGLAIGFVAGWRGGWLDEVLQTLTYIVVMIPSLVLLIVIGAYLKSHSAFFEGVFIGVTTWPWVARAVRAQTFTLRQRDFVDLARLSGKRGPAIVLKDIAPNMASYILLAFILLFGSSMLIAVNYDFLGLGPTNGISLGDMLNLAELWSGLQLHMWWWFIPPGAVMTLMVAALLVANVGLDEVFNPKLRET
ncbi:MAG: ABC transporter permease [Actinomycetota bacterium]|nr:ABC transporter permease [Actinomycetota bacterium]